MNIEPQNDFVFIVPMKDEEVTADGIFLGVTPQNKGEVYAGGNIPKGAVIYFRGEPERFLIEGEQLLVVDKKNILCLLA